MRFIKLDNGESFNWDPQSNHWDHEAPPDGLCRHPVTGQIVGFQGSRALFRIDDGNTRGAYEAMVLAIRADMLAGFITDPTDVQKLLGPLGKP